jgi:hypothetical protein
MTGRPAGRDELVQNSMHQVYGDGRSHRTAALSVLGSARQFRKTAQLSRLDGLRLPVISNLHESARLAISAIAAANGLRFSNVRGAHVAVVDYAFAIGVVNRDEWSQLDELRDLRHKTNYPSDLIEPGDSELDQFCGLVDAILARIQELIAPIPPPPMG